MILSAVIRGRVQGVGFRYWVLQQAREQGLKGWVRNAPDGSVEVEAEGSEDQLFDFEQSLWRGPVLSRVDKVHVSRHHSPRDFNVFDIR